MKNTADEYNHKSVIDLVDEIKQLKSKQRHSVWYRKENAYKRQIETLKAKNLKLRIKINDLKYAKRVAEEKLERCLKLKQK